LAPRPWKNCGCFRTSNADKDLVLQLILIGQPELREILRGRELVQFAQRIAVDYYLPPLTRVQATEYIGHRLKVAGGDPKPFESGACDIVHTFSRGIPRLINILCDTTLYGYAAQAKRVDVALVREVVVDKSDSVLFSQRQESRQVDMRRTELEGEAACRRPFRDNDATEHEVLRDLFSSLRAKPTSATNCVGWRSACLVARSLPSGYGTVLPAIG
jgi:hypothetical protein